MADQGASPREQVLEACRRNNTELLEEVFASITSSSKSARKDADAEIASLLNNARDGIGSGVLHIAASAGGYEVLDLLLDQPGLEVDELDRMEGDTPLHKAVRYVNESDKADWEHAIQVVDILLDAGCDPRIRNKAKLTPRELADPRNTELRSMLQKAEYALMVQGDVVDDDDDGGSGSETD
ncbi:ankyrin repeat domain-containing protein [Trichodelitschia bisporula]|uniref:Ankyrin repeat domain-containing protein n=1 Tax=Trichodelitschia bisporula TaxID=703511 RepID=A0A6G1I5N3_9PEZI|nr:ankyrin repeat domain-containing protein [Trichodelitschia bisporula]